jgi:DNA-binding NarL/FixJ family response regulator
VGDEERKLQPKTVRVLVVCAYRLAQEGLSLLFSQDEDISVVGVAPDVAGAQGLFGRLRPDVIVFAHATPNQNCPSQVFAFKAAQPEIPVLVVSPDVQPGSVQAVLAAGATGYLTPEASADELIRAVYVVAQGEVALHPTILQALLSSPAARPSVETGWGLDDLTPREQEILSYLVRGLSDRDIAQTLFISVRTVQTHLAHIYEKLDIHSRIEAAILALRSGWPFQEVIHQDDLENT